MNQNLCKQYFDNIQKNETQQKSINKNIDDFRNKISDLQAAIFQLDRDIATETTKYNTCISNEHTGGVNRKYIRKTKSRSSRTCRTNYRKKTTRRRRR